jgi:hypothetical protein
MTFWIINWRKALRSWKSQRWRGYSSRNVTLNISPRKQQNGLKTMTSKCLPDYPLTLLSISGCIRKRQSTLSKSMHECWERMMEKWNAISAETYQKLIESMPKKIKAVIRAKGGHTDY